jgi:hypothetical protein
MVLAYAEGIKCGAARLHAFEAEVPPLSFYAVAAEAGCRCTICRRSPPV